MTAIGIGLERHGRISQEDYGWGSILLSGTAQPDLPLAEVYGPAVILTNHREVLLSAQLIRATRCCPVSDRVLAVSKLLLNHSRHLRIEVHPNDRTSGVALW